MGEQFYDPRANAVNDFKSSIRILRMNCSSANLTNIDKLLTALSSSRFDFIMKDEERFLEIRFTEVTDENNSNNDIKYRTSNTKENIETLDAFNNVVSAEITKILEDKDITAQNKEAISNSFNNYFFNYQNISSILAYFKFHNLESFE